MSAVLERGLTFKHSLADLQVLDLWVEGKKRHKAPFLPIIITDDQAAGMDDTGDWAMENVSNPFVAAAI